MTRHRWASAKAAPAARAGAVRLLAALAVSGLLVPAGALAQSTGGRPAARAASAAAASPAPTAAPAPAAAASTRAFGTGSGPILTRDELRVCLSQEESVRKRVAEHEGMRGPIDREKEAITTEQAALRAERATLEGTDAEVGSFNDRMRAHAARVDRWNQRVKAFNEAGETGGSRSSTADREREREREGNALNAERAELEKASAALKLESQSLQARRQEAVRAFNAKAGALDARVGEWNKRNAAWNEAATAIEGDRLAWVAGCANRRYREDDEIAIRRGGK